MTCFDMKRIISSTSLAIALLGFITLCNGALDSSFNANGIVTTPIGSLDDGGRTVAIQADGKILVGGYTDAGNSTHWDFALVRYNSDGTVDNSFGASGKVVTSMGIGDDGINAILVQSDKKIVVVGNADTTTSGFFKIALARYDSAGVLDPTFGVGGKVRTAIGTVNDRGNAAALQADGKIVVAGRYTSAAGGSDFRDIVVLRYNTDGTLDAGFGTGGKVITFIGSKADEANCVVIQPDGKILVSGYTENTTYDIALIRLNADGTPDPAFGTGGKVLTAIGTGEDGSLQIRLQGDGKIVMAGHTDVGGGDMDWALLRYNGDGSLDGTFGTGGKTITSFGTGFDVPLGCIVAGDGRIFLSGWAEGASNFDFAMALYTSTGILDNTFGIGGKLTLPIGSGDDMAFGSALQGDGKIVITGQSYNGTDLDFALIRVKIPAGTAILKAPAVVGSLQMKVAPNPVHGWMSIRCQAMAVGAGIAPELHVFDLSGRMVATLSGDSRESNVMYSWNTAGIPAGMYMAQIKIGEKMVQKKIMLVR